MSRFVSKRARNVLAHRSLSLCVPAGAARGVLLRGSRGCCSVGPVRPLAGRKLKHAACRPALDAHKARLRVPLRAPLRQAVLQSARNAATSACEPLAAPQRAAHLVLFLCLGGLALAAGVAG